MTREKMLAALGATNEAILRTKSRDELFQRVCDAAVSGGIGVASAFLPEADGFLRLVASAGRDGTEPTQGLKISVDPDSERGRGLAGVAYRTCRPAVSNDFQNDPRFEPWRREGRGKNVGAGAGIPIVQDGKSVGVFLFFVPEAGSLTPEMVDLLQRMVENVSFSLGVFEQEGVRARMERANRRITTMFAALSATNTAILRATSEEEMFRLVCEAVAQSGGWLGAAAIFLMQPDSDELKLAAVCGQGEELIRELKISTDPASPFGTGLGGSAFREKALKISYDLQAERRNDPRVDQVRRPFGAAAVPLLVHGNAVGVFFFFFARTSGAHEPALLKLMQDIAENTSFGLAAFARAEESARVSRMYAALSATNEAIMRSESREEMCRLVCEAAVNGAKFTSTTIGLHDPSSDFFRIIASSGPYGHRLREIRLSPRPDIPEGQGLSGQAFRTLEPAIANDYRNDPRSIPWRDSTSGSQSGAGLPLLVAGRPAGFVLFMSKEKNTFTPEFVDLLCRLAENVSFALENFDRREEARRANEQVTYLAKYDALTGLPNRVVFKEMLDGAVARAQQDGNSFSVLFIDLDRFKLINDSLGHAAGDELLQEIAGRLQQRLGAGELLARLGGDEFVLVLTQIGTREAAARIAAELLALISEPIALRGHEWRASASIGIAMYPHDGFDGSSLTRSADVAMYLAKDDGKNDFRFHTPGAHKRSVDRLRLETDLRRAMDDKELWLQYQPKVDVATGRISGVEALLRWTHPVLGLIEPATFIPVAEEAGLIVPIGKWVLRTACAQIAEWQREGLVGLSVAVNLSPRQFTHDQLLHDIDEVLNETRIDPDSLQLEVTESTVMQNVERAARVLEAIKSRGVRLAIDDFGTGYSSLSLMKHFPIDTIKIDRSFIKELPFRAQDKAIANAIIALGKALGLTIVAEGVETREQEHFLRNSKCDEIQGFLYSRAVDAAEVPGLVVANHDFASDAPLVPEPVQSFGAVSRRLHRQA
ncbi:EAL domain-containing protein [Bradyrhizobium sp. LHD-71]|uniref:bifunctional diguanylate cyclase/phosphodiesterase n=1 Tax=Bradyrhizobium sp. LHD-71 TaxID=3072141 RepID=UPI00280CBB1B|nr:EAL domain-containing protein [Bradyrhizobium sp. LHD-71]MDQ8730555.1 EAL domain-containing protein [Bradyrhizobium sp. LHD-71]